MVRLQKLPDRGRTLEALIKSDQQRHARLWRDGAFRHMNAAVELAAEHRLSGPKVDDLVVHQPVQLVALACQPQCCHLQGVIAGRQVLQVFAARLAIAGLVVKFDTHGLAAGHTLFTRRIRD